MLNAIELKNAVQNLSYPASGVGTREERQAGRDAYIQNQKSLELQFRAYLAFEYADGLPTETQDAIWEEAWEDGHSYGYGNVELYYEDYADLAYVAVTL